MLPTYSTCKIQHLAFPRSAVPPSGMGQKRADCYLLVVFGVDSIFSIQHVKFKIPKQLPSVPTAGNPCADH